MMTEIETKQTESEIRTLELEEIEQVVGGFKRGGDTSDIKQPQ